MSEQPFVMLSCPRCPFHFIHHQDIWLACVCHDHDDKTVPLDPSIMLAFRTPSQLGTMVRCTIISIEIASMQVKICVVHHFPLSLSLLLQVGDSPRLRNFVLPIVCQEGQQAWSEAWGRSDSRKGTCLGYGGRPTAT